LDLQALHRVRERLVGQRTGIINQIRAFLLERGVAVRQGLRYLRAELPGILATRTDVLSPRMLRIKAWPGNAGARGKASATASLDDPLRAARLHAQAGTKEQPSGTNKGTVRNEELSMT